MDNNEKEKLELEYYEAICQTLLDIRSYIDFLILVDLPLYRYFIIVPLFEKDIDYLYGSMWKIAATNSYYFLDENIKIKWGKDNYKGLNAIKFNFKNDNFKFYEIFSKLMPTSIKK